MIPPITNEEVQEKTNNMENNMQEKVFFKKFFHWRPSQDNIILSFCRESTIHGLKYLGLVNIHTVERIIWLICIASLTLLSVDRVVDILEKYFANPIMVSFQPYEIRLEQIPFPAVTICNANNIRKSKAMELIERHKKASIGSLERNDTLIAMYFLQTICDNAATFSRQFSYRQDKFPIKKDDMPFIEREKRKPNPNVFEMVDNVIQNCSEMIKLCSWKDSPKKCEDYWFSPITTDFGECCVFNMMPLQLLQNYTSYHHNQTLEHLKKWESFNIDKNILASNQQDLHGPPMHQLKGGLKAGLSFLVDSYEDEYFCPYQNSVVFQLIAGSPIDYPKVKDFGIGIRPQTETYLDIHPELTMADDNIQGLDVSKRHCYFDQEWPLKYFNYYTTGNCVAECLSNLMYNRCNCTFFTLPREPNQTVCLSENYECPTRVERDMTKLGIKTLCKDCLPACTQIKYDLSVSKLPLDEGRHIWKYYDSKKFAPWVKDNVSLIHVYFGSDTVYSRVRQRIFDSSDLIGQGGGLLGLYIGFSLVSALEIFYLFAFKFLLKKNENGQYIIFQIFKKQKI